MSLKIRKSDTVLVISGKDRGKKGRVLKVVPKKNQVIIEGISILKKHSKPTQANPQGGITQKEAPVNISNVMLICPSCSKPTRTAKEMEKDRRVRKCLKCGALLGK